MNTTVDSLNHHTKRTKEEKKTKVYFNPELAEKTFKKAKFYVEKLNFSVIPIAYGTKKPIAKWKEFQTRLPSQEELRDWFGKGIVLNVGLVTGKISRVVILDVDDPTQMPDWLKEVKTWVVKTNRGYHYYFRIREDEYVPTMHLPPVGQLKAEGSYVLLPESLHPDGAVYRWMTFVKKLPEPASFDTVRDRIYELAKINSNGNHLKPLRELYFGVKEGERNVSLTRIAGSLYADGLTPEEVYEVLRVINERNEPPLPEKEVRSIVNSIGKRRARMLKKEGEFAVRLVKAIIENAGRELFKALEDILRDFETFQQELPEKDRIFVEKEFGKIVFWKIIRALKQHYLKAAPGETDNHAS